jgi:hypothetical protein
MNYGDNNPRYYAPGKTKINSIENLKSHSVILNTCQVIFSSEAKSLLGAL